MNSLDQAGYIFNFQGHGAFDPNGKIEGQLTQAEIDAHNAKLAAAELQWIKESGKGMLYLHYSEGKPSHIGTWASTPGERIKINYSRKIRNNFGADRLDVWFYLDGKQWHGVNVGDNDLVRIKRNK